MELYDVVVTSYVWAQVSLLRYYTCNCSFMLIPSFRTTNVLLAECVHSLLQGRHGCMQHAGNNYSKP